MYFHEPFGGVLPGVRGAVLAVLMRTEAPLTGRQVHALTGDGHGLWSVQQALKELEQLGMTSVETVGRAGVHRVNEEHVGVVALRPLLSPLDTLTAVVQDAVADDVTVLVFGSVATGRAHRGSDLDLAVVAPANWDGRGRLEDAVRHRLGRSCDVVHLTPHSLRGKVVDRDAVIDDILRDGIVIVGAPLPARYRKAS